MRSAEAAPAPTPEAKPRYDDGDIDLIMQEEGLAPDPNEGVTYPEGGEPWVMPEAYSEVPPEVDQESVQEPESVVFGRETLRGSKALKQWTREQAFTHISNIGMFKSEVESGIANVKRPLLERKQKVEGRKVKKYESRAKTSMFAFRRASYARKARWARNRLSDAVTKLAEHNQMFGNATVDENGKLVRNRGKINELRKKRLLERMRKLELQRSKLLEIQIVAREHKRRRQLKNEARNESLSFEQRARLTHYVDQLPSVQSLREGIKKQLKSELQARMRNTDKIIQESDRRWRWYLENDTTEADSLDTDLASLDQAVGKSRETASTPDAAEVDKYLPELEDAAQQVMADDKTKE